MEPLRHGYTNRTLGDGTAVVKCYEGPDAVARSKREREVLSILQGRLPLPQILDSGDRCLTMTFMSGIHGQEMLEAGHGSGVLRACGTMLRRIHQIDPSVIDAAPASPGGDGRVLVHGDYGPQNVLLDPEAMQVAAVLDWEWAHAGNSVEDLAWCEWIVRMHHPGDVSLLGFFFDAYGGAIPRWPDRQQVMVGRCRFMLELCHRQEPGGPAETQWARRLAVTAAWPE
jgi:aminoglycoside phosphotransferase (APT) family kinase protein